MRRTQLRRVRHLVQQVLDLAPDPWDIDGFLDRLEAQRGRPIDLCAIEWSPGSSTGAWHRHPDHDVIVYATNTSAWHQDVIILHEVGHMLLEHRPQCVLTPADLRRIQHLRPQALAHLLGHAGLVEEERQAEQFARSIMTKVGQGTRDSEDGFTHRVGQALG